MPSTLDDEDLALAIALSKSLMVSRRCRRPAPHHPQSPASASLAH